MELQFRKSTIPYLNRVIREVQNQEQTQEIRLTDGMPDIGKILCAWGQVVVRSKEWRNDSASFSGGVMVWVLYAPEDGTQPRTLESWIPFLMKWDLPRDSRDVRLDAYIQSPYPTWFSREAWSIRTRQSRIPYRQP